MPLYNKFVSMSRKFGHGQENSGGGTLAKVVLQTFARVVVLQIQAPPLGVRRGAWWLS